MAITLDNVVYPLDEPSDFERLCCVIETLWVKGKQDGLESLQRQLDQHLADSNSESSDNSPQTPIAKKKDDLEERYRSVVELLKSKRAQGQHAAREARSPISENVRRQLFVPVEESYGECLVRIRSQDPTLTHIQLKNLSGAEVKAISGELLKNPNIQDFSLANSCYLGSGGCTVLKRVLPDTSISVLRFNDCNFYGNDWIHMLAHVARNMWGLTEIHLSGWRLNDSSVPNFFDIFKYTSVTTVTFEQTRINPLSIAASQLAVTENQKRFDDLMSIICKGDIAHAKAFIEQRNVSLSQMAGSWSRYYGYTPLMLAALSGKKDMLILVLENQFDCRHLLELNVRCQADGPHKNKTVAEIALLNPNDDQDFTLRILAALKLMVEKSSQEYYKKEIALLYPEVDFASEKLLTYKAMIDESHKVRLAGRQGYSQNKSYALGLPVVLVPIREVNFVDELVENTKLYIIEHAERRVELLFYLLVAYYKTGFEVELGTIRPDQDGAALSGLNKTDAAHSGLLNNVTDSVDANNKRVTRFCNTHFFKNTLSSTVEVPIGVNRSLDCHLEGDYTNPSALRKSFMYMINSGSKGQRTPITCLSQAFFAFKREFDATEKSAFMEQKREHSDPASRRRMLELTRLGTFKGKFDFTKKEIATGYVDMLLRLRPEQVSEKERHPEKANEIYEQQIALIGDEIRHSPA